MALGMELGAGMPAVTRVPYMAGMGGVPAAIEASHEIDPQTGPAVYTWRSNCKEGYPKRSYHGWYERGSTWVEFLKVTCTRRLLLQGLL